MENEDRHKNMVFRYLDELFKNINIEEIEFPKFNLYLMNANGMSTAIEGKVGGSIVFRYFPDSHTISFNRDELKTMVGLFGFNGKEALDYVKSYFKNNVKGIPNDTIVYST
jgi:hypothetical protein